MTITESIENKEAILQLKRMRDKAQELESQIKLPQKSKHIRYRYVEICSKEEAIKHGKHCGWCTGESDSNHYDNMYQHGRLWVLYKPKNRRPSYQLFIGKLGVEFRKKGNKAIDPWEFASKNPLIKNWMRRVLPKREMTESRTDFEGLQRIFRERFNEGLSANISRLFDGDCFDSLLQLREAFDQFQSPTDRQAIITRGRRVGTREPRPSLVGRDRAEILEESVSVGWLQYIHNQTNGIVGTVDNDDHDDLPEWRKTLNKALREQVRQLQPLYGISHIPRRDESVVAIGGSKNGVHIKSRLDRVSFLDFLDIHDSRGRTNPRGSFRGHNLPPQRIYRTEVTYIRERIAYAINNNGRPSNTVLLDVYRHSHLPPHDFEMAIEEFFAKNLTAFD